ncbi:cytochrome b/b6 domain-containing protein [Aquisediminimonas profunda]|uniref:cytochrome b/b6 domain-containing protein n=1 Tax=Aquisediminimonas profunda TaxID=1550733 RepID=UPI001C63B1A2|nr:cytochrome b/b6 domain-containing protein [Aquisediminimonas profunda]
MKPQPPCTTFTVWDLPVRLFHWLLVASIAIGFLSSEEDSVIAQWHIAAGWVAAVLIVFRLVWGIVGGEHARFANFIRPTHAFAHLKGLALGKAERTVGHNPAGGIAVLLLIGTIAAVVATGWIALQGGEEDIHEGIAWFLLGLIGIHIAAVVATSILSRENLVRAMVTGCKKAADHPDVLSVRPASPAAFLFALAASGAAVAGIQTVDPQAFSLQQREGIEREGVEGARSLRQGEAGEHEGKGDRD